MKKLAVAVAVLLLGIGLRATRFVPKFANVDWERWCESMPDNAPPKWMFRNISEIHDDTDRILELLDGSAQRTENKPGAVERSAT